MGRVLVRGEPDHDIIPELAPQAGEPVVDKPGKGAFYATNLHSILSDRGVCTLIVCGVTTEVCVNTTVREANDRGYECLVLSPRTVSRSKAPRLQPLREQTQTRAVPEHDLDDEILFGTSVGAHRG